MARFLRRLRARIKYWNNAAELNKELDAHREMAAASFAADGTPERESRWKAARLLGNTAIAREDSRAVWVARWIEQGLQDIRYALRTLRREWGFAIAGSITLAIGLGVLVGVFTVFNAVFLRQWPVRSASDVFGVSTDVAGALPKDGSGPARRISYAVWRDIRPQMQSAELAAKYDYLETLRPLSIGPGRAGRFALVDDKFLETIGIKFQTGMLPASGDVPGLAITDAVWRSAYGSDPQIVGKAAWLGGHPVVITGVLEPRFHGFPPLVHLGVLILNQDTAHWLTRKPAMLTDPGQCCIEVFGRKRPGFTFAQISNEIALRANAVHAAAGLPIVSVAVWNTAMASRPGGVRNTVPALFALLFTGCGIVTLLACANIGNLQLARGLRRSREVAVRLALGASRRRLVRQFLTESAVLACIGGAGGLAIAWTVPSVIMSLDTASSTTYKPDATVILFAAGTAVLATLLSGLAPAIRVTRIDWRRGASTAAPGAHRLRGMLLATQIALSLGLIASASLLSRGALRATTGADAGFEFENIDAIALAVTGPDDTGASKAARAAVHQAVAAIPNVALVDNAPWTGISETVKLSVPGRAEPLTAEFSGFNRGAVTLLHVPLIAGRWHSDDKGMYEVTVTRSLARALWNDENVLGRTFVKMGEPHPYSVVGMIDEVRLVDATARPTAIAAPRGTYLPTVLGRPGADTQLKSVVAAIDPSIRVMPRPLIDGLKKQMKNSFIGISIASGLGLIALLLASLGVFGVVAYVVEERRREIGVRLALGANRAQVRRSIVAAMRWPVIGGLAAGFGLALIGGYVLRSNLYGLSVLDPLSYLAVAGLLSTAAIAATYIPMRRATRVDPAVTLRAD